MTFLEQLQSHKGGLLYLKTELYWYGGRGYDRSPDRVCLILDAGTAAARTTTAARAGTAAAAASRTAATAATTAAVAAFLLIDGSPQWVWVAKEDVAFL